MIHEQPLNNRTILLIDDDRMVLQAMTDILEMQGATIYLAANGRDAVSIFQTHAPTVDLILLDLHLPDMDGLTLIESLLSLQADAPIVVVSGDVNKVKKQSLIDRGARGFLEKPFNMMDLLQLADRFFNEENL